MIYILHGENLSAIRNFILKIQEDNNVGSKKELILEDTSPSEILENINSVDMFGAVAMLTLDVSKMGRTNVDEYLDALAKVPEEFVFVIFSNKELSNANAFIKNSTKVRARILPFKEVADSNIFKFIDFVFAGNRKETYRELRKLILSGEESFYLFTMLNFGLRNISYAKFNSPAFNKLAPFVKSKAKTQASKFSEDSIKYLYEKFYELDLGSKSGRVSPELLVPLGVEAVLSVTI